MKKIFFFAIMALAMTACGENYVDEQMDSAVVMNKGVKTEKAPVKDKAAKGPDQNAKNQVSPCVMSAAQPKAPWKINPPIIRHPTEE